jgi:hypothetical protein
MAGNQDTWTRRVDDKPETDADKRFFDLRESGYTGRPFWWIRARHGQEYRCHPGRQPFRVSRTPRRPAVEYPGSPERMAADRAPPAIAVFNSGRMGHSSGTRSDRNVAPDQKGGQVNPYPSRAGCRCARALPRTGCVTDTRPGSTTWVSGTSSSRNGWATRYPACVASTATSRPECAPSFGKACKNYGRRRFMAARCSQNVLRSTSWTASWLGGSGHEQASSLVATESDK